METEDLPIVQFVPVHPPAQRHV